MAATTTGPVDRVGAGSSRRGRRVKVAGERGLYRRVTAAGEVRFDIVVWQAGRQRIRALPRGTTERQAHEEALRARALAMDGNAPMSSARRLRDVVVEYLAHAEGRTRIAGKGRMSESTIAVYRPRLRDYVLPTVGTRKLSQLGRGDVLRVLDACHAAGLSDWTTHGVLTAFRAVLRFARERDYMRHDPFADVPRDRLPAQQARRERRALRPEEAALLLTELHGTRDHALGCLLADAGLRVSEALGLTWADVSLSEGVLTVRGQLGRERRGRPPVVVPPKSRRGVRVVPLLPRLRDALESLYAGEDDRAFVLRTRSGRPLSRHNARRTIREAGKRARLGDWVTPHVLRHTFGTACSNAGVPVAAAAAMLGHSVEVNHSTYVKAHRDAEERENARKRLVEFGLGVTPA